MATKTTSLLYELTNTSGFIRQRAWLLSDTECTELGPLRFGRRSAEVEMEVAHFEVWDGCDDKSSPGRIVDEPFELGCQNTRPQGCHLPSDKTFLGT